VLLDVVVEPVNVPVVVLEVSIKERLMIEACAQRPSPGPVRLDRCDVLPEQPTEERVSRRLVGRLVAERSDKGICGPFDK